MDSELRELLDLANHVFYLGGNPELILLRIKNLRLLDLKDNEKGYPD